MNAQEHDFEYRVLSSRRREDNSKGEVRKKKGRKLSVPFQWYTYSQIMDNACLTLSLYTYIHLIATPSTKP